jgi:hypothetical protein
MVLETLVLIVAFIVIEWNGRENQYAIESLAKLKKKSIRYAFYFSVVLIIYLFMGREQQFIYFQF